MTQLQFAEFAAFGALLEEALHWHVNRRELDEEKVKVLKSPGYWVVTLLFIVVLTPAGTVFFFYELQERVANNTFPILCGAVFPLVVQKLVRAFKKRVGLGGQHGWWFDAYFR